MAADNNDLTQKSAAVDVTQLLEESDRGAVLVAAALLEDELRMLLTSMAKKNGLTKHHLAEAFAMNGPLSSFSSKTLMCYATGLISKVVFDDLNKLRKLRNRFAHGIEPVSFQTHEIATLIDQLTHCSMAAEFFEGADKRHTTLRSPGQIAPEWHARARGLVLYHKSVFCVGVALLQSRLRNPAGEIPLLTFLRSKGTRVQRYTDEREHP